LNELKLIASLITDDAGTSLEQLLHQFTSLNENIYFESFRKFCEKQGVVVEHNEFIDLLKTNKTYVFNECGAHCWTPTLAEGYVSNILPGDWDDFGDDQIEGITKPAFGDGAQQQPMDFTPLSTAQLTDDPDSIEVPDTGAEEEPDVGIEEPDLPDFDTRVRHRPSRSVKELESRKPDSRLIEHDANVGGYGSMMSRVYDLVDSWQNGAISQPLFEQELNKLSADPTIANSNINPWTMVQKILTIHTVR
jgi:hypothetical protein